MSATVLRIPLDSAFTPAQALLALRDDVRPFALVGDWAGGGALVGSAPVRVLEAGEDPLAVLDSQPAVQGDGVGGGWVGWLGYGASGRVERPVPQPPRPVPLPEASWAFYDHLLRLDAEGRWWFEALPTDERSGALDERARELARRLAPTETPPEPRPFALGDVAMAPSPAGHAAAVRRCRELIAAGDLYQANLTLRLDAPFVGEAIDLFATGAHALRPARGAYVGDPAHQVCSFSPELFLERRGRAVRTAPIKGTAERTGDPHERTRLETSAKDGAEHVMIVDLMRNDLGRVAAFGSVEAHPPRAEEHPGVWHLVSDVTGRLRDGVSDADLLRATFPPGSVTGAPKVKALEVIAELESTGREAYTGAVGFASPAAGLELNVAIRTFEVARGRAWLGAGGGVVADSDPAAELEEALTKARPLLAAVGALLRCYPATRTRRSRPQPPPPVRLPRPDPAAGVLETLLAVDGRLVDADAHRDRLERSARAVLHRALAPQDWEQVERAAAQAPRPAARVRVVVTAHEGLTVATAEAHPFPADPVELVALTLSGGAGEHKWADRRLLDLHPAGSGREALVVDLDGTVLETGRGTVWIAEGDRLVTPPADGRILPGTLRARLLRTLDEAEEGRVDLARLHGADEVLVTSTVRGVQAVAGRGSTHARRLAGHLAAAWGLAGRAPAPA